MNAIDTKSAQLAMVKTIAKAYGNNTWVKAEDLTDEQLEAEIKKLEIMVYGLLQCHYIRIGEFLNDIGIKEYSYIAGFNDSQDLKSCWPGIMKLTAENNTPDERINLGRVCKAGITRIVLLNYIRVDLGLQIVPVIFCIEKEGHPAEKLELHGLTGRVGGGGKLTTGQEIRRAYKLCTDPDLNPQIRRVAQMTIRFFKVAKMDEEGNIIDETEELDVRDNAIYALTPIPAPWEHPDFIFIMDRKAAAKKEYGWKLGASQFRSQFNALVEAYHADKAKVKEHSAVPKNKSKHKSRLDFFGPEIWAYLALPQQSMCGLAFPQKKTI